MRGLMLKVLWLGSLGIYCFPLTYFVGNFYDIILIV
jgi:hypothetical protein